MPSDSLPPPQPSPPPVTAERRPAPDPRLGTTLADRYYIHSLIGEGGMGKVYAGEHVLMHKRVAIKVLHKELTTLPDVVSRFEREAMAAANIDHPNVAAATDFGHLPEGSVFLVLEFVQGISLRSEIAEGPFAVVRALHIARQIASALASAHARGIVHRDLKPENVMLVEKAGDPDFVKVLDFGIAKVPIQEITERGSIRPGQIITKVGMIFGTPEYMAPEQALGQEADGRADQYALGVILFEMLSGNRPYRSGTQVGLLGQQLKGPPPTLSDCAPNIIIPLGVDELLGKMLAADRELRFDNCIALVEAIEGLLLMLQPNLLLRGSRPDASQGPLVLVEGPISTRQRARVESSAGDSEPPEASSRRSGEALAPERVRLRLLHTWKLNVRGLPTQLGLALLAGLGVGALAVIFGLIVVARRNEPEVTRRRLTSLGTPAIAEPAASSKESAPVAAWTQARANGAEALDALARQYPHDPKIVIELAKLQFANTEYSAAVGSVARALVIDKRVADDAEVATLLWKAVQKRECRDATFQLLDGPMGARGADILYDLATTDGIRRDIKTRAEEHFTSGRYRAGSSPALANVIALKTALNCEERKRCIEQASSIGDERLLPFLESLTARAGCGDDQQQDCNACLRTSDLLERTIDVIRRRSVVP